jgi:hypothetical protein
MLAEGAALHRIDRKRVVAEMDVTDIKLDTVVRMIGEVNLMMSDWKDYLCW